MHMIFSLAAIYLWILY